MSKNVRLSALFERRIELEWSQGGMQLSFARTDMPVAYSGSREASGLVHLVSILTAAYDNDVGALLIDEPEVSLHPQLQAYVATVLREVAGDPWEPTKKLVIISTHSPHLLWLRKRSI
jgi:predicted ATP-dependent endonuclease of OLD family